MKLKMQHIALGLGALALVAIVLILVILGRLAPDLPEVSDVPLDPQSIAYEELKSASSRSPVVYLENGIPRGLLVDVKVSGNSAVERAQVFLQTYADLYRQDDPALALEVRRTSEAFAEQVVFYQTYQGIPVYAAEIVIILDGERVFSTVGGLLRAGVDLDINPGLSNSAAESIARRDLGLSDAPIFGQTSLMVLDPSLYKNTDPNPHLVWRVTLGDQEQWISFVDAHNGDVVLKYELTPSGTGGYDLDLEDANGFNSQDTNCFWDTTEDDQVGDEDELYAEGQADPDAAALWNHAKSAYVFYHDTFGIHSYDDNDGQYELYVHAPNEGGAQWIAGSTDCDLIQFSDGLVAYDILVHELAHAVITFSSGLVYQGESGALNESYADVMGAIADGNWMVGEGMLNGQGPIRRLDHPPFFGDPDQYMEYVNTSEDHGGVHTNSGIPNKAAFLIAAGGSHPANNVSVGGIGSFNMRGMAFAVMRSLPANAKFIDARNMSVAYADQYFNASARCDVRNAFFAVGLGQADINCDGIEDGGDEDGDGIPYNFDNCHGIFNPDQVDVDEDGWGRACDPDDNGNNQPDYLDTVFANPYIMCPTPFEPCDTDNYDGDKYPNEEDNCPHVANDDQVDTDEDGQGDACDPDADMDGWSNDNDNCPWTPNEDQANADGDFAGDACDQFPNCPDVYAWSTGMMIGDTHIPPQPIQDPLACSSEFALDDGAVPFSGGLDSDGRTHRVDLTRGNNLYARLPIPPCSPSDPDQYAPEYRGFLVLEGMSPEIRPWVADDRGQAVSSKQGEPGALQLQFMPQGGRSYFLTLADFREPGQMDSFSLSLRCGLRETMLHPTPDTEPAEQSTASMTPTGTPAPTETLTPTPKLGVCTFTALANLFCRTGPGGSLYPAVDSLVPGQSSPVLGLSPDGFFAQIEGVNNLLPCYVPLGERYGTLSGTCDGLPTLIPPPPPPSETPTIAGCTQRQSGGDIICVHPCPDGAVPGEACIMP